MTAPKFPIHSLLQEIGVDRQTGKVTGPPNQAQKRAIGKLARQMGVPDDALERLVAGHLDTASASLADIRKMTHYLDGAFRKETTQEDGAKMRQVGVLLNRSMKAQTSKEAAVVAAGRAARAEGEAAKRGRHLETATAQLETAERHLAAVANSTPGSSRDRRLELASRATVLAFSHLKESRPADGKDATPSVPGDDASRRNDLQGRIVQAHRDIKTLTGR